MWNIFGKKELNSQEFETLLTRLINVEQRVRGLELSEEDFRDKVLRKIQKKQASEITEQPEEITISRRFGGKSGTLR